MNYYIGDVPFGDDLEHAGILSMKWGVRRYQNPDGTYTELGKERRRKGGELNPSDKPTKRKKLKDFTDDEILERTERLRVENAYLNELRRKQEYIHPKKEYRQPDHQIAVALIQHVGGTLVRTVGSTVTELGKTILQTTFDAAKSSTTGNGSPNPNKPKPKKPKPKKPKSKFSSNNPFKG